MINVISIFNIGQGRLDEMSREDRKLASPILVFKEDIRDIGTINGTNGNEQSVDHTMGTTKFIIIKQVKSVLDKP